MDTKLTLKLDKVVIEQAKEYARSQNNSLSRLIENYLRSLTAEKRNNPKTDMEITPFVRSLSSGVSLDPDYDYKKEYAKYLEEKYK